MSGATDGTPRVFVEVRGGDAVAHSLSPEAGVYSGSDTPGLARGGVDDLGPGQSRTVALLVVGRPNSQTRDAANRLPARYDRIEAGVDGVAR